MPEKAHKVIWLLTDGIAGHENQSKGLVHWLRSRYDVSVCEVPVVLKWRAAARLVLPAVIRRRHRLDGWLRLFYRIDALPDVAPDVILSAGGNTSFANALLAGIYRTPNVLFGSLRKLPADAFSVHLTLEPTGAANNVVMPVTPSVIDTVQIETRAREFLATHDLPGGPYWALLVGGDGAGFRYVPEDWTMLAQWMNDVAEKHQIRWLVTTSRRTDVAGETILKSALSDNALAFGAWWHDAEQKVVQPFMGLSERVFVTADSMTMVTEAIASERPVGVLICAKGHPDASYRAALERFRQAGFCQLLEVTRNEQVAGDDKTTGQGTTDLATCRETLVDHVVTLLGW